MKKKDEQALRGGLQALFSGSKNEAQTATPEASSTQEQQGGDILDTVEDEALREALRAKRMVGRGRPRKDEVARQRETAKYTRFTTILNREQLAKVKEIGFRETLTMKEIFEEILGEAIAKYEATHGAVIPTPHKGNVKNLFK